jgi:hypothetical protein
VSPIFSRAVSDSFLVFDTGLKAILLTLLGAIVTAAIVWFFRGWGKLKEHVVENIFIVFGGAMATWLLVFVWVLVHVPAKMLVEADTNLTAVISEKQDFSRTINSLNQQIIALQQQIDFSKHHSPIAVDVQLENDAYRLAENIDSWWSGFAATPSATATIFDSCDYQRFSNPPDWFMPNDAAGTRRGAWMATMKQGFRDKYLPLNLAYVEQFKQRGIQPIPSSMPYIENPDGPIAIRQTVENLRQSAGKLATRNTTPTQQLLK